MYCEFKFLLDPSIVASSERGGLIARSDMALHNQDWTENVIGKVSEWIDLDCSEINTRCIRFLFPYTIMSRIIKYFIQMMAAWWQHMLYSIIYCIQLFIVFNYLFFKLCYIASYFIIQCNIVFIQYCITMLHHIVSDHILWDFMIFCFMILHYYIVHDIMCLEDILIRLNSELISLTT